MSESITFTKVHYYDTLKAGITVGVSLRFGDESVDCEAKIDTGSSHSIFKRAYGELLGIDVESTDPVMVSTMTGTFSAFPHRIEMKVSTFKRIPLSFSPPMKRLPEIYSGGSAVG